MSPELHHSRRNPRIYPNGTLIQAMVASFPPPILAIILYFAPDFETLRQLVLTCKALHNVFQAWPTSVMLAVAGTVVGPRAVLAPAMRLARLKANPTPAEVDSGEDHETGDESDGDGDEMEYTHPISVVTEAVVDSRPTWREATIMTDYARLARRLEVHFSRHGKDRTTGENSRLSAIESLRFQRAFYRLMTFCLLVDDYPGDPLHYWSHFSNRVALFFCKFSNQELIEMKVVALFVEGLYGLEQTEYIPFVIEHYGLDGMLYCFENSAEFVESSIDESFGDDCYDWHVDFACLLTQPVRLRGGDIVPFPYVLDAIVGEHDKCTRCGDQPLKLNRLQNCSTWVFNTENYIGGYGRPLACQTLLTAYFPGQLSRNEIEGEALDSYVVSLVNDDPQLELLEYECDWAAQVLVFPRILSSLFELSNSTNPVISPLIHWKGCDSKDWLCTTCIDKIIHERLWVWWLSEKLGGRVEGALPMKGNCSNGYECRKQIESSHASNFNHLCVPTSDDYLKLPADW